MGDKSIQPIILPIDEVVNINLLEGDKEIILIYYFFVHHILHLRKLTAGWETVHT